MLDKTLLLIIIFVTFKLVYSTTDYCGLCENGTHTMCKYGKGPSPNCLGYRQKHLTLGEKKYIVDIHNDIRNHVASGMETRGALGSQPPAADMLMMEWDEQLAEIAQRWADQCVQVNDTVQHDICKRTERFEVGQNILTAITKEHELPELSVLIFNWYQQVINVVPSDIDVFLGVKKGKYLIGQYTQLVWSETRYVGCGIVTFTESNFEAGTYQHRLVCNYGPAGNVIGEAVYQRGTPCSKCLTRRCDATRNSLCQGTDSRNSIFSHIPKTQETRSSFSLANFNYSDAIAQKMRDAICFNPDGLFVTKCITATNVSSSNSEFDVSNRLNYMTFTAMDPGNVGFQKPDQRTLKNLVALWNRLKLKNITDNFDTFLLNSLSDNSIFDGKLNTPKIKNKTDDMGPLAKIFILANFAKYDGKLNDEPFKSKLNETLKELHDNPSYISNVIPSSTVTSLIIDNILNQNITVFDSSQVMEAPIVIDKNFDMYHLRRNITWEKIKLDRLDNGIVFGDGGEKHHRYLKDPAHRALQSYFKTNQDFSDIGIDLPNYGQFRKVRGYWQDGHCQCVEEDRSDIGTNLTPTLLYVILLILVNIILTL